MNLIKGFFQFWYDFIVGDCWEIAAGIAIVLGVTGCLIGTKIWMLSEITATIDGEVVTTKLQHPGIPLIVAGLKHKEQSQSLLQFPSNRRL
jgi:hypothetical protein